MFRKLNGIAAVIALIFCVFLNAAAAQENTFTEKELQDLIKSADLKLEGKAYRTKKVTVVYSKGTEVFITSKTTTERLPPDRIHEISEWKGVASVGRYEVITIGEKLFERKDDGEWKDVSEVKLKKPGRGSGGGDSKIELSVERRLIKGETVNNKKTDRYETVTTTTIYYTNQTQKHVWKRIYWFDAEGMYVKIADERSGDSVGPRNDTTEYEYDRNIKIEAPVLPSAIKSN